MSVQELTDTEVIQRCGKCDRENRIALSALVVGIARDEQLDDGVVPLPACPTCRSTECLLRSPIDEPEHPAPGSFGHLHRLLVDHIHAELVTRGNVIAELRDEAGNVRDVLVRPLSATAVSRWFDKGLRTPTRRVEAARAVAPDGEPLP